MPSETITLLIILAYGLASGGFGYYLGYKYGYAKHRLHATERAADRLQGEHPDALDALAAALGVTPLPASTDPLFPVTPPKPSH